MPQSVLEALTKYHTVDGLNNRNVFSQFWRLKVWDQYTSGLGFFWGLSPWPSGGRLLPVLSRGLPFTNLCVLISFSQEYKIGLGVSFLLNLCEEVISKCSDILRYWGLGLQRMNSKIQPIILLFYAIALWQWDRWAFKSQELLCSNKSLHKWEDLGPALHDGLTATWS